LLQKLSVYGIILILIYSIYRKKLSRKAGRFWLTHIISLPYQ
jgi:hypothetical protein